MDLAELLSEFSQYLSKLVDLVGPDNVPKSVSQQLLPFQRNNRYASVSIEIRYRKWLV